MNMQRRQSGCGPSGYGIFAAAVLGLLSAVLLAQAQPGGDAAGSGPPAATAPAGDATAPSPLASLPEETTATGDAPVTVVVERRAAGNDAFLDLNVRAFRPPQHGAVEAVVTLGENKNGGREVDVGAFSIFPAKEFEAANAADERGFRLDAAQALAELGGNDASVRVKVRLSSLRDGESIEDAKLTLGKVRFAPRAEAK